MSLSVVGSPNAATYLQQTKQTGSAKAGEPVEPLKDWLPTPTADTSATGPTAPAGGVAPFDVATLDKLISAQGQATSDSEEDTSTKPAHPHGHHHHVADSDATSSTGSGGTSAASIGDDPIDPGVTGDSDATVAGSGASNSQSVASLMEQLGKMQSQVAGVVAPIVSALV